MPRETVLPLSAMSFSLWFTVAAERGADPSLEQPVEGDFADAGGVRFF
jgi:hypothetical protein